MGFEFRSSERHGAIYSAGDCPVCADSGALLLLKAIGTDQLLIFCPMCGIAWRKPPVPYHLDEILTVDTLAPEGVVLPTAEDIRRCSYAVLEVPWPDWLPLLKAELERVNSPEE